jgi:hypothetical protein
VQRHPHRGTGSSCLHNTTQHHNTSCTCTATCNCNVRTSQYRSTNYTHPCGHLKHHAPTLSLVELESRVLPFTSESTCTYILHNSRDRWQGTVTQRDTSWGETMSLNCSHQWAHCSSPRWYVSVESHGGMILTGKPKNSREKPVPVPLCPPQIRLVSPVSILDVSAVNCQSSGGWIRNDKKSDGDRK